MRIAGINIPDNKRLEIGLTAVYGIGRTRAKKVLTDAKVDIGAKPSELSKTDETKLRELVEGFMIEGDLRRNVSGNIKRLKDIRSYRGDRHTRGLPVRGQRTKSNGRNARPKAKRKRATATSGKRKVEKK